MVEPRWQKEGTEPDYRFSLANERTFLAWIRTALAVLAGAVALEQFVTRWEPRGAVVALAVALAVLSAALCAGAYRRWKAIELAMRQGAPLPGAITVPLLAASGLAVAAAIALLLVLQ